MTSEPGTDRETPAGVGRLASVSIDSTDPTGLADFYTALLGMSRVFETPDGHLIAISDGTNVVTLMYTKDHVAPTWPGSDRPQQLHLDVTVSDLATAVTSAVALGATEADHQPSPQAWRVPPRPGRAPFLSDDGDAGLNVLHHPLRRHIWFRKSSFRRPHSI